ncbi:hypothetical protein PAXRUDRAFT_832537 [Paxillus rubicundulus Ve08.2h10]|uniref:Amino acid transporter transmembrane domain-containing protein n=1 Tax=Paxillus rubicundulus Ve08.2h10 TaxID=930991 RepID=A0A0D0DCK4_9AGAM|nr:hypothetical protein PAXRUDRAFT_832537 [Paxillus rubicundulus Ve08.2h10]
MTSLPTSFPYGSASSAYSVRGAFISYCRSQYYASSSVQPFDLSSELSDDDLQTSELAQPCDNSTLAERHAQQSQCRADDSTSLNISAGECQRAVGILPLTCPNPRQFNFSSHHSDLDRARRIQIHSVGMRSSGREITPLLKKAASFSSQPRSVSVGHVDYKSLSLPEVHSGLSQSSSPASPGAAVEHHHGGKSTYGQTLFNCIAVLLGIGMLSEPLAFAYAGWFWGTTLIIFFGAVTCYTAKLLTREILLDPRLRSYADIGRKAFGPKSSLLTNSLFCLELFSVSVVLVTLAADSLHGVWPAYSANTYKVFSVFVLVPTVFMPLSILSFTSLLGVSSTLLIISVIFIDGFSKPDSPGSLWSPAQTSLSPGTLGEVGVAFGLFMAGFSGHVVIPSLARDMIDPSQFNHMANWAFTIATFIYAIIGCAGYLMFGLSVSDEVKWGGSLPDAPAQQGVTDKQRLIGNARI